MGNFVNLVVLGLVSAFITLRLLVCGSTAPTSVNLFITSLILMAGCFWFVSRAWFAGAIKLVNLSKLGLILIVWAVIIALSPFLAAYKFGAFGYAIVWLGDLLLFYLVIQWSGEDTFFKPQTLLNIFLATAGTIVVYALYQYLWGLAEVRRTVTADPAILANIPPQLRDEFLGRVYANEPFGTFIYQNALAAFLVLVIPIFIGRLVGIWKSGGQRLFGIYDLGFVILMVFVLYTSGAKGGWIAAGLGAFIFAIFLFWSRWSVKMRWLVVLGLCGVIATVAIALRHNDSVTVRLGYWQGAGAVIKDNFWTGVGLNNFGDHYTLVKAVTAGETTRPHNVLLEVFTELGVFGFIAFGLIWLVIFIRGVRRLRPPPQPEVTPASSRSAVWAVISGTVLAFIMAWGLEGTFAIGNVPELGLLVFFLIWLGAFFLIKRFDGRDYLVPGLLAGVVGFLIHSLGDFNFSEPGLTVSIWLVAACLVGGSFPARHILKFTRPTKVAMGLGALVVILILNAWFLPRLMQSDNLMDAAKEELNSPKFIEGVCHLQEAESLNPFDARPCLELAHFYHDQPLSADKFDRPAFEERQSVLYEELRRAIRLSPWTASLYYYEGDFRESDARLLERWEKKAVKIEDKVWCSRQRETLLKESAEAYRRAVHFYPTNPEYLYRLGRVLDSLDQRAGAVSAYEQALYLHSEVSVKRLKLTHDEEQEIVERLKLLKKFR